MGAAERTPLPLADPRDPRCLAPLALPGRVSALATAVPHAGALVREGRTARRGTPFWLVTFRLVAGDAAGAYAELRLWPASESGRFERMLCELTGEAAEAVEALDEPARLRLLETTLRSRSLHLAVEIASDGRCTVVFANGLDERVEPGPGLPEPAPARVVAPPPPAARPALGAPRYELVEDAAGLAAACGWIARTERIALDIETDCGPLGSPAWWEPDDGAIRLLQVAGEVDGQVRCAVVDCYRVAPGRLLRLLADPEREIVAHNARYEQRWLAFHHGLPAWQRVLDTSVGYRVLEAHWRLQDPAYEPIGASLVAVSRQLLAVEKGPYGGSWWGSERLTREQLDYAALDALTLLPIARRIEELASAMGCAGQIAAASATACREGLRRLPEGPAAVRDELWGMLGAVRDRDALARVGRIAARVPLAAADRGALRDEYRRRRESL